MVEQGYIIDTYSPYGFNDNVCFIFKLNERQWCIRKIEVINNIPQIELPIDDPTDITSFHIYKTFAAAKAYTKVLKRINL